MRTNSRTMRFALTALLAITVGTLLAQDAAPATSEPLVAVNNNLNYAMVALAVVQAVLVLSLAGIIRTMMGNGEWMKKLVEARKARMVLVPALLLVSAAANAQEYKGAPAPMRNDELFWVLVAANVLLFIVLLVQMNLLRGMTRAIVGTREAAERAAKGPSWADRVLEKLTKRAPVEQEKDILMHHEYDGIRELDNVLPPWWLWLFYGSIAWSVLYLVNVHLIDIWPTQKQEYVAEMEQAKADIAAYNATLSNTVDETNVTLSTDATVLANGKETFTTYCTACHGPDAAGTETSVGPNLTDVYWLHGGGIQNVFKTIKYGVPEKGMVSWKAQLKPAEIQAVASYILSQAGKGGAGQKAPQGEPWSEAPTTPDSTAVPEADTLQVAAK